MSLAMGKIGSIEKDRRNKQGEGYNFRGIDDVYNAFHPILVETGIFIIPTIISSLREERTSRNGGQLIYTFLTVKYTFYCADGSSVETIVVGEGFDSGDKSANKAMSGAQKYAFLQTFCVPTEDHKDSEIDDHDVLPKKNNKSGPTAIGDIIPKAFGDVTDPQIKRLYSIASNFGWEPEEAEEMAAAAFGIKVSFAELTKKQYESLCRWIETMSYKDCLDKWNAVKGVNKA